MAEPEPLVELVVPAAVEEAIRLHGRIAYPEEACGILIGKPRTGGVATVSASERLPNVRMESRETRYNIDPLTLWKRERSLEEEGLAILGIYHSHPDHPGIPSAFDLEHALPTYIYVVIRVAGGVPQEYSASVLADDRSRFHPVEVKTI